MCIWNIRKSNLLIGKNEKWKKNVEIFYNKNNYSNISRILYIEGVDSIESNENIPFTTIQKPAPPYLLHLSATWIRFVFNDPIGYFKLSSRSCQFLNKLCPAVKVRAVIVDVKSKIYQKYCEKYWWNGTVSPNILKIWWKKIYIVWRVWKIKRDNGNRGMRLCLETHEFHNYYIMLQEGIPGRLPACLPACLLACLPACLPCLFALPALLAYSTPTFVVHARA